MRYATHSLLLEGDSLKVLKNVSDKSIQSIITSPPYWGLRDYGISNQIGHEATLQEFISSLVSVFFEAKRVLKDDGTLWVNIGDGYTSGNRGYRAPDKKNPAREMSFRPNNPVGLKNKDLIGIPWRLAFALQENDWYLRSEIIWHKPNAMPESVKDRPTRAHEHIFLFSKSEKYFYDYEAIKEIGMNGNLRNCRSIWEIKTDPSDLPHSAVFSKQIVERCILASSKVGDIVLDPFSGIGTVGIVSEALKRSYIGIDINPEYVLIAKNQLKNTIQKDEINLAQNPFIKKIMKKRENYNPLVLVAT